MRDKHEQLDVLRTLVGHLTPRERQVFERVVQGKMNKEIAYELGATERTIKAHRQKVMEKVQVASLAELVVIAKRSLSLAGRRLHHHLRQQAKGEGEVERAEKVLIHSWLPVPRFPAHPPHPYPAPLLVARNRNLDRCSCAWERSKSNQRFIACLPRAVAAAALSLEGCTAGETNHARNQHLREFGGVSASEIVSAYVTNNSIPPIIFLPSFGACIRLSRR